MLAEFNILCGRGQDAICSTPLQEVCIYVPVGGSKYVRAQHQLQARQCKVWHGLHESSYCYRMTYAGTHSHKYIECRDVLVECE